MKPIFKYKGKIYSHAVINGEVVTYRIDSKRLEIDFEFDEEMQKQLALEFAEYEATLMDNALTTWLGEK